MFFTSAESALKHARDLELVGRHQLAAEALLDMLQSRKHRTWSKHHEEIMFKFVDLCLELKLGHFIKDGLLSWVRRPWYLES